MRRRNGWKALNRQVAYLLSTSRPSYHRCKAKCVHVPVFLSMSVSLCVDKLRRRSNEYQEITKRLFAQRCCTIWPSELEHNVAPISSFFFAFIKKKEQNIVFSVLNDQKKMYFFTNFPETFMNIKK